MTETAETLDRPWLTLVLVLGCPVFVVYAVVAELIAAQYSNSAPTGWELFFSLSWPQPARVAFWLVVTAASAGFRIGLSRLGFRQRPLVVAATVAPFLFFAIGIALGSSATTWH